MIGFKESPWVIHYDASSCNGCDIETLACLTPVYDVERLGVVNTGNPKHADIFLVTGAVNEQSRDVIRNIYDQLVEPKVVVAIGACAASGGIFAECYNVSGGVDTVIPVDIFVPGCAARPEAIIDGVVQALGVLERKKKEMVGHLSGKPVYLLAGKRDAPEILSLQKTAYRSEAEIYGDESLPALHQSLGELQNDFDGKLFVKAVINGKIIGAMRGYLSGDTAHLSRVVVHPHFRGMGIGKALIGETDSHFPTAKRFEVFTGHKSKRNLDHFHSLGYKDFKTEDFSKTIKWIYLEKRRE